MVSLRGLAIGVQFLEKKGLQYEQAMKEKQMALNQRNSFNTEMSDMSSFSKDSSNQSLDDDPTPKVYFRTANMENFKDFSEEYNPKVVTKSQLEEFRTHVNSSILENIIAGLENLKADEKPKHMYDHKLGFGEAPANTHEGL